MTNIIVTGKENKFFPLGLTLAGREEIVYFDLVARRFRVLAISGEVLGEMDVGNRVASIASVSNSSEIYFKSVSYRNWYGISTREINDCIRGPQNYEKAIEALRFLKENSPFRIVLMFTVMKKNLSDIVRLSSFCKALDLDSVIVERFFPLGEGKVLQDEVLDKADWRHPDPPRPGW